MPVAWIANPVTLCALAAVGLSLALYLFCTLKIEMRAGDGQQGSPPERREIAELCRRLEAMEERWRQGDLETARAEPPGAVRPGMNLNRRSQALRLYRRGETPGEIARLLGMPGPEVRLPLQVHRMLAQPAVEGRPHERRLNPLPEPADMSNGGVKPPRRSGEAT